MFGRVTEGMDVVDKIEALPTVQNNQPAELEAARIQSISINDSHRADKCFIFLSMFKFKIEQWHHIKCSF